MVEVVSEAKLHPNVQASFAVASLWGWPIVSVHASDIHTAPMLNISVFVTYRVLHRQVCECREQRSEVLTM